MTVSISGTSGITFPDGSLQTAAASPFVLRNRIINGDMRIDQRRAGASVTITDISGFTYTLDRWHAYGSVASKFSVQQNAASVTPPTGFTNYFGATSLAATTVAATDQYAVGQFIEGFNIADLAWGTVNAQSVTLSFWVYSSLTGSFGGVLRNSADNYSYPFTYTISSANTWTKISITIAGATSGTWVTNNGIGVKLFFGLGVGSTFLGTAGSWSANAYTSSTGATNVVSTNGATFYITGVQLEVGSSATPFERRMYGIESSLCQRYYIGDGTGYYSQGAVDSAYSTEGMFINLPTQMRTDPTVIAYGWNKAGHIGGSNTSNPANSVVAASTTSLILRWASSSPGYRAYGYYGAINPYLSAEL